LHRYHSDVIVALHAFEQGSGILDRTFRGFGAIYRNKVFHINPSK
jgi:hypothetical protein